MVTLSSWSYTSILTFWSVTQDQFGQTVYTHAFSAPGTWKSGGETQTSDDGIQFTPASSYWIERGPGQVRPQRGWKVCVGQIFDQPPAEAEIIRKAGADDDTMHGFSSVDWAMWT